MVKKPNPNFLELTKNFNFFKLSYFLTCLSSFSYTLAATSFITPLKDLEINKSKMCYQNQIKRQITLSDAKSISVLAHRGCQKYDKQTFNYIWENNIYPVFVHKNEPNQLLHINRDSAESVEDVICDADVELKDFCPIYDEDFLNSNNNLTTMKHACLEDPVYAKDIVEERLFWSHDNKLMSYEEAFLLGLKNMYPVFVTLYSFKIVKDIYAYIRMHDPYFITPERVKVYTICPKQ